MSAVQPLSDPDAMLAAILDNPADDAPRLVLADWLEEHDAPRRAELIRLGCCLARMDCGHAPSKTCPDCRPMKKRRAALAHHALRDWEHVVGLKWNRGSPRSVPLRVESDKQWAKWVRRGFLERIRVSHGSFVAIAPDLFRGLPIVDVELAMTVRRSELFGRWSVIAFRSLLPFKEIVDRLRDVEFVFQNLDHLAWRSRRRMLRDISQACVSWGREQAGLPPLHTPAEASHV